VLGEALAALDNDAGRALFRFGGLVFAFASSFRAWALAELGDFGMAEKVGLSGMQVAEDAQQGYSISVMSFGLAYGLIFRRQWDRAIAVLERGMELVDVHGIAATIGWIASKLAYAYAAAGRIAEAKAMLERVVDPKVLGATKDGGIRVWIAATHLTIGETDAAGEWAEQALQIARSGNERGSEAWASRVLGEIALQRGQGGAAATAFRAALDIAEALGMLPLARHCHRGLGAAARLAGRQAEAEIEFAAALALGDKLGIVEAAAVPETIRQSL